MRTYTAQIAREEQDKLVDEYLSLRPGKAKRIARLRRSWVGRMVIIELLEGAAAAKAHLDSNGNWIPSEVLR